MIPVQVKKFLGKSTDDVHRYDYQSALKALHNLGVAPSTEFGEFYLEYQGGFISPRPVAELLDIEGPAIPAVPDQTDYARDRYQLPEKFLPITSDESEGMYLYNKEDKAVYDFDLSEYKAFMDGKIPARWESFNEFLVWYFDESQINSV
ncbi:MAG: SMI1/KNR4 family protein [Pseudomonas sp.]|uniref:SMI1/KNR4 family protein n=1 Tax=Pseudomonas sp. TaxID=306 RepID=UPI003393EDB9